MAQQYDLTLRAGNSGITTNETGLVLRNQLKTEGGVEVIDLTDSSFVFVARTTVGGNVVLRKESPAEITVIANEGLVTVPISVADSRALYAAGVPAGQGRTRCVYELERRYDGKERTLLCGSILVEGGVNDDA